MLKLFLIALMIAVTLIQSAEFLFSRLEIKPAHYQSIVKCLDADPRDVGFLTLVGDAMTDGKIRSHEHQEIVRYILRREGMYRYAAPSDTTIVEARQILQDRVL